MFHYFSVLCDGEYLLKSNLHCCITNVTSFLLALPSFLSDTNVHNIIFTAIQYHIKIVFELFLTFFSFFSRFIKPHSLRCLFFITKSVSLITKVSHLIAVEGKVKTFPPIKQPFVV